MAESAGVKVFCRFRPFNKREIGLGANKGLRLDLSAEHVKFEAEGGRSYDFPFDYCWDGSCYQTDVYSHCAAQSVKDVFEGYNGTIFAYGQVHRPESTSVLVDCAVRVVGCVAE